MFDLFSLLMRADQTNGSVRAQMGVHNLSASGVVAFVEAQNPCANRNIHLVFFDQFLKMFTCKNEVTLLVNLMFFPFT